jgi:DNA-binding transcriptional LysR family regulator
MTQPTITFQINSLEEAFGVKLFERDRQQVRLTDAGSAFRKYAQSIMDTVDAAHECLSGLIPDYGCAWPVGPWASSFFCRP